MTLKSFTAFTLTILVVTAAAQNVPPLKVGNGVSAPSAINAPNPVYPEAARKAKYECSVVLWTVVTTDGRARDTKVARPCGMGMDEAAVDAVKNWTFKPAMKDGKPVDVEINVNVNFRLNGAATPFDEARAIDTAMRSGDYQQALPELESFVRKHPDNSSAWQALGQAQAHTNHLEEALASFHRAADLNNIGAQGDLGHTLILLHRFDEAITALNKALELAPGNAVFQYNLATAFMDKGDYSAATKELESIAPAPTPPRSAVLYSLAVCYLHLHQTDKAVTTFETALAEGRSPGMLNNVAYEYAQSGVEFQRARDLVKAALAIDSAELRSVDLNHLSAADYARVSSIAREWDTLGWIEVKDHELSAAEPFLRSAWELDHSPVAALHLGELNDKTGAVQEAIRWYALSDVLRPWPETHKRLLQFAGTEAKLKQAEDAAEAEKAQLETITVPNTAKVNGESEFVVEIAQGKVIAVKLSSGDRGLEPIVRAAATKKAFPAAADVVLIRRGNMRCASEWPNCEGTLLSATHAEAAARKEISRPATTLAKNEPAQAITYTSTGTAIRLVMPPEWHIMSDQSGSYNRPGMLLLNKAGTVAVIAASREHLELNADAYQKTAEQRIPLMLEEAKVVSQTPITRSGVPAVRFVVTGRKNGMECRAWLEVVSVGDEHFSFTAVAPAERFMSYSQEFEKMLASVVIPGTNGGTLSDSSLPK